MLNNFRSLMAIIKIKPNGHMDLMSTRTEQEDPRTVESIKRVKKTFEQNKELINARALKPHSFDCEDNLMCDKDNCWQFVADRIVGNPYRVK